jgi:hypothetical protein
MTLVSTSWGCALHRLCVLLWFVPPWILFVTQEVQGHPPGAVTQIASKLCKDTPPPLPPIPTCRDVPSPGGADLSQERLATTSILLQPPLVALQPPCIMLLHQRLHLLLLQQGPPCLSILLLLAPGVVLRGCGPW